MPNEVNSDCYDELVELAMIERFRVLALFAAEKKSGSIDPRLNVLIKEYADLLLHLQRVSFDLGFCEYRRIVVKDARTAEQREAELKRQVFEVYSEAKEILHKRLGRGPAPKAEPSSRGE